MKHPESFRIIGFLDASFKWHGDWQTTRFRPEDCFVTEHMPTQSALRKYATEKGYWPSHKRGSTLSKCEPVYETIGDTMGYVYCKDCFPTEMYPTRETPIDYLGSAEG